FHVDPSEFPAWRPARPIDRDPACLGEGARGVRPVSRPNRRRIASPASSILVGRAQPFTAERRVRNPATEGDSLSTSEPEATISSFRNDGPDDLWAGLGGFQVRV